MDFDELTAIARSELKCDPADRCAEDHTCNNHQLLAAALMCVNSADRLQDYVASQGSASGRAMAYVAMRAELAVIAKQQHEHTYHQVFDARCRTYRRCEKCGYMPDDLALR